MPDMAVRTAFTATDKLSPAFKKMSSQADKFGDKVSKSFKKASSGAMGFKSVLGGILAASGIQIGFQTIKSAIIEMKNLASDYNETIGKVGVAFGEELAPEVVKWGKTTLKQFGLSKGTALDMIALYGDMSSSMGLTQKASAQMGKELVGRAADLASYKNISIDVANTAMKSIFTGETESLKGLGVVMTQANLKAYALEKGMNSNLKKMSQAELVNLRFAYVMEKTKNAMGDFARTSGGVANQERMMSENMKELGINLGTYLQKPLSTVYQKINLLLGSIVQFIGDADKMNAALGPTWKILKGIANVFFKLFNIIKPFLPIIFSLIAAWKIYAALQTVIATVTTIATMAQIAYGLATNATTASAIAYTAAQWAANAALMAFPAVLIIAGIALLILAIVWLVKNWDMVKVKVIEVWNNIKTAVSNGITAIIGFFQRWGNVIIALTGPFAPLIAIITSLFTRWNEVVAAFKSGGIIGAIKQIGVIIMQSLLIPLKGALQLLSKLPGVGNVAKNALAGLNQMTAQAPQSPSPEAPNSAEVQSRYYQNTTVNVNNAQPGTSASVTPKKSASINYNMIGANP